MQIGIAMSFSEVHLPLSESTVIGWLQELGVPFDSPVELTDLEYQWALRVGEEGGPQVLAVQQGGESNNIRLQNSVNVSPQHREVLRNLDRDSRDAFYFDLKITLLQQPVGYGLTFLEDEPEILGELTVGINLLEEEISRGGFFRRHHQVRSTTTLAVQLIQKLARFESWR